MNENGGWTTGIGQDPSLLDALTGEFTKRCEAECKEKATKYVIGSAIAAFAAGVVLTLIIKK